MNDEYILNRGYKQYAPTAFDSEHIIARFQKRFDDNFGKKYFIDIKKWSNKYIPMSHRNEYWKPFSFEYEIYTTMFEEEKPMIINFYSDWTIEEVENFAENFFEKIKPNYYENWDGERRVRPE